MSSFVLDTSATMAFLFKDEDEAFGRALIERLGRDTAIVPALWQWEVANAFRNAEKRGRTTPKLVAENIQTLARLPIERDAEAAPIATLVAISRQHNITAYDACYLELALRKSLPLATLDRDLMRAAPKVGVELIA